MLGLEGGPDGRAHTCKVLILPLEDVMGQLPQSTPAPPCVPRDQRTKTPSRHNQPCLCKLLGKVN